MILLTKLLSASLHFFRTKFSQCGCMKKTTQFPPKLNTSVTLSIIGEDFFCQASVRLRFLTFSTSLTAETREFYNTFFSP